MNCTIINPENYRQMPWKNGRGVTCEILRRPADEATPFHWRVSIADIGENGPFSPFDGYERIINTLEGGGMRLKVDGRESGDLKKYQPFAFSGQSRVESELLAGPIRDFNLIYLSGIKARLEWRNVQAPQAFCSGASEIIIYAVEAINIDLGEFSGGLKAGHTLYVENPGGQAVLCKLTANEPGPERFCCVMEIY